LRSRTLDDEESFDVSPIPFARTSVLHSFKHFVDTAIRRAGWCLVECPECGAEPGKACTGIKVIKRKRSKIAVHDRRQKAAKAKGLGGIGWHTFRHTYRSLLSACGTPLDVQKELMRHAELRTTMDYGGAPMANKRAANGKVVAMLVRETQREVEEGQEAEERLAGD
jgi:hypothetical protein